jgi:type I restriction enzyme, S subunit
MNLVSIPISRLATVHSGGGAPQDAAAFTRTGFPFIRAGSLPKLTNGSLEDSLELIEPKVADEYGLKLFPAGTVLFAKSGMSATKGHVYRLKRPAYIVNHLAALVPYEGSDSAFLAYALQRYSPTVLIKDPAYPSIRLGDIESMRIQAPTFLCDRQRIAAILDKAAALRAKRRSALAHLDILTQTIFLAMFGDPFRNTRGLPTATLGELGSWQSGGTPPRDRADYFEGSIPWFSSGELVGGYVGDSLEHISEAALRETSAKSVPKTSLMLGMYDTAALKLAIAGVDCACNQAIAFAVIDPCMAETQYVYSAVAIGRDDFRRLQRGVRQKNLNLSMVRDIRIPLPPLALQRFYVRRTTAADQLKALHYAALAQFDSLFLSLQHRAFRGEL